MISTLIRIQILAEALAYAALGTWLHAGRGWGWPTLAAAAVAAALLIRLAIVGASMTIAWMLAPPRAPEHRIGALGTLRLVVGEWRAMLADNFFYLPFDRLALRPDRAAGRTDRVPVLLVHGYFSNRGILRAVVRALDEAGVHPVRAPNFRGILAPIEALVDQLDAHVEAVLRETGQPRAVLVCHSMGGLVARAWLARHGSARLARLITIASPHHGTGLAVLGVGPNAVQMRRDSGFLAELAAREGPGGPGCPATSIYSPHDNLVSPQETSRLAWARNIALPGLGHVEILLSPRLHRILLEELREAGVAADAR